MGINTNPPTTGGVGTTGAAQEAAESVQTTIHAATHHVHAVHLIVLFQFMRVHRAQTLHLQRPHVKLA